MPPAESTGRLPGLDVLRGAAVLWVIARHLLPDAVPGGGIVGVVVFFTLSGYLITDLLASEYRRSERIDLARFYRRRASRLVPALLLFLAVFSAVTLTLDPLDDRGLLPATVLIAVTWTADLPFGHASTATFHLWTLALEEQFYLVWPVAVSIALRRRRSSTLVVIGIVVCMLATAATTWWLRDAPDAAYSLPTSWAGSFVLGGSLRLVPRVSVVLRVVPGWCGWCGLGVLALLPLRGHWWTYLGVGPLISVLTLVILTHAVGHSTAFTATTSRLLGWLGVRSYGAYLWNYPIALWLAEIDDISGVRYVVLALVMTIIAAWVSHRWVEVPARQGLSRHVRRARTA